LRPVHRLDVRASGVVVLARNTGTAAHLSESFRQRQVGKKYDVRLWGSLLNLENEPLRVSVSLTKRDGRAWVDPEGKESVSIFRIIERDEEWTEVEVSTETGRFHQVRVHAAHLGFPVWGDVRYGAPVSDRLYLHASELSFPHPHNDQPFSVLSRASWRG
jgi:23S rRNA-/tRNA-specific pseudouridylate synthase